MNTSHEHSTRERSERLGILSWRRVLVGMAVSMALFSTLSLGAAWQALGKMAEGARLAQMQASPQWSDGKFRNVDGVRFDFGLMLSGMFRRSSHSVPEMDLPVQPVDGASLSSPVLDDVRVTWLGHSSVLLEVEGVRVLTDPIFGGTAGPLAWAGPAAWYDAPLGIEELPELHAVLISHDHYDHLQMESIQALLVQTDALFIVPLGVGAHLEYWGVPSERMREVDWWDEVEVGSLRVVSTPSRHASGRHITDQSKTLWTSFALIGPQKRVYFSGDTGFFPGFEEIGERLGPFDLGLFEVGAYNASWADVHLGPEQAIAAHRLIRGDVFMPIHWGLFNLAYHGWTEPAERVRAEAAEHDVRVAFPRPGDTFLVAGELPEGGWWPELPWDSEQEHPVTSSNVDPRYLIGG